MTKKDLFDGLNYIDDQIIEEAQPTGESAGYSDEIYVKNHETHHGGKEDKNRKKHKKFARAAKALATVAAVLVVAVLGTEVVRLKPSVAVVDEVVDSRGTREVATEYLSYLYSDEAQRIAGDNYYRPYNQDILKEYSDVFDLNINLVTISDFGGWDEAQKTHFADGGIFDKIYEK